MFTFIDLFAGIGGFRVPLEEVGGKCVFSSEWDKHAIKTYKDNFNEVPKGDITKIKEEEIPGHDLLTAGFPCQPFSIAGKMKGFSDTRGTLFFDVARIVKYHKPKVVVLENVRNFATHDNGNTLEVVINTLEDLNYEVKYKVLNAKDFGLPQNRERIFLVCINKYYNFKSFNFPQGDSNLKVVEDILEKEPVDIKKLLINRDDIVINEKNMKVHNNNDKINKRLRLATINKGGQGDRVYSPKGIGITLSAFGGGSGSKTGAYYIDSKIRKLSPRETARMQGFPETFKITVSNNQAWTQFGNSVPINVVREIMEEVIKTDIFD